MLILGMVKSKHGICFSCGFPYYMYRDGSTELLSDKFFMFKHFSLPKVLVFMSALFPFHSAAAKSCLVGLAPRIVASGLALRGAKAG